MATKLIEEQREFNDENEKDVIVISESDCDDDLVCDSDNETTANNESNNGNGHSMHRLSTYHSPNGNNKKRKFAQITTSNSEINHDESEEKPQRKKRKLSSNEPNANTKSSLDKLPNPNGNCSKNGRLRRNHSKKGTKTKTKSIMKKTEYVQCEYLEPMQLTKGSTMNELYTKMSEWSGIKMENIQIAKI